jgi:hypothetical protein
MYNIVQKVCSSVYRKMCIVAHSLFMKLSSLANLKDLHTCRLACMYLTCVITYSTSTYITWRDFTTGAKKTADQV